MSEEQKPSATGVGNQQIRHDLVNTAVNFLLNPSVINSLLEHKTAFLRKKGLTEAEIALAVEKAESNPNYKQIQENSKIPKNPPALPPPVPVYRPAPFWSRLSRFSSSMIVLGVALFGVHYVYKNYIEPFIFGTKSRNLEEQLNDMANSISQLESRVLLLDESITSQKEQMGKFLQNEVSEYYPTPLALRELKAEITSVKSLLLNRHQFPALPKVSPTIPPWQLPSENNVNDTIKQNGEESEQQYSNGVKDSDLKIPVGFELSDDITANQNNIIDEMILNSDQPKHSEELCNESPAS